MPAQRYRDGHKGRSKWDVVHMIRKLHDGACHLPMKRTGENDVERTECYTFALYQKRVITLSWLQIATTTMGRPLKNEPS